MRKLNHSNFEYIFYDELEDSCTMPDYIEELFHCFDCRYIDRTKKYLNEIMTYFLDTSLFLLNYYK